MFRPVWAETPIRADDGSIVAALGFGRIASERFARLLALTTGGTSRDAFAFDEEGRIVTVPRDAGRTSVSRTALAGAALERREASQGVIMEPYAGYRGVPVIALRTE